MTENELKALRESHSIAMAREVSQHTSAISTIRSEYSAIITAHTSEKEAQYQAIKELTTKLAEAQMQISRIEIEARKSNEIILDELRMEGKRKADILAIDYKQRLSIFKKFDSNSAYDLRADVMLRSNQELEHRCEDLQREIKVRVLHFR